MAIESAASFPSVGTVVSSIAAVIAVVCAVLSYRLNRKIHMEAKADDRMAFGKPYQPDLRCRDHSKCVIRLDIFNTSKRKAFIDSLTVYDKKGREIPVTWAGTIDELGTPQDPSGILGVVDTATICIRRDDGEELEYARITFKHSLSDTRSVVVFDEYADFIHRERVRENAG